MSNNIVQHSNKFLQVVKPVFPKKIHKLLEFGFKSLSIQRIISLNSNARSIIVNHHTAESKAYRLTKNLRFVKLFPKLLIKLKLIKDGDIIAIDFSDFHGMQVLMFAKQTRKGRTIPLFFDVIVYPIQKGSQNIFIKNTISEFFKIVYPLNVKLVFDRGFAIPTLIKYLAKNKVIFYIRIKSIKRMAFKNKFKKAREFKKGIYFVEAYDSKLSLTVTAKPNNQNTNKLEEPWYIISSDLESEKENIQEIYYYRFEIEEFFKDAKRKFGLEDTIFRKINNFKTALWFVILGFWLHQYLEEHIESAKNVIKKCKDSFNQSITHYWLEQIKFSLLAPMLSKIYIKGG